LYPEAQKREQSLARSPNDKKKLIMERTEPLMSGRGKWGGAAGGAGRTNKLKGRESRKRWERVEGHTGQQKEKEKKRNSYTW